VSGGMAENRSLARGSEAVLKNRRYWNGFCWASRPANQGGCSPAEGYGGPWLSGGRPVAKVTLALANVTLYFTFLSFSPAKQIAAELIRNYYSTTQVPKYLLRRASSNLPGSALHPPPSCR
jgi:hypothetical protein